MRRRHGTERERRSVVSICLGLLAYAFLLAGCGGASSSSSTTNAEPSAAFLNQKDKKSVSIVRFGDEATKEEREVANAIVVESLKAREEGDFATQCQTLNMGAIGAIPNGKDHRHCAAALKQLAEPLSGSKEARKDTLSGSIAALRVKGDRGYALYHGTDGKDYAVPLEKEGDSWKVSSVLTTEL